MNDTKRPDMIVPLDLDPATLAGVERKAKELNITEQAFVQLVINDWIQSLCLEAADHE